MKVTTERGHLPVLERRKMYVESVWRTPPKYDVYQATAIKPFCRPVKRGKLIHRCKNALLIDRGSHRSLLVTFWCGGSSQNVQLYSDTDRVCGKCDAMAATAGRSSAAELVDHDVRRERLGRMGYEYVHDEVS
jgi:hypothetical protein